MGGEKILLVKSAEAQAESKYLSGVGVARQRKAIVDGLRDSISQFSGNVKGSTPKDVIDLLLLTQYFDMLKEVGTQRGTRAVFLPRKKKSQVSAFRACTWEFVRGDSWGPLVGRLGSEGLTVRWVLTVSGLIAPSASKKTTPRGADRPV